MSSLAFIGRKRTSVPVVRLGPRRTAGSDSISTMSTPNHRLRNASLVLVALLSLLTATADAGAAPWQSASDATGKPTSDGTAPEFLSTPAATLDTFLGAVRSGDYARAIACFSGGGDEVVSSAERSRATRLAEYLRHLGYTAGSNQGVPEETDDALTRFSLLPAPADAAQLTLERSKALVSFSDGRAIIRLARDADVEGGAWLFDEQTLSDTNLKALQTADLELIGSDPSIREEVAAGSLEGWILVNTPASLRQQFLFVMYWQWIALGILIFLGFLGDLVFRLIFRGVLRRWVRRFLRHIGNEIDEAALRKAARACGILIATIIWRVGIELLFLPLGILEILLIATSILVILAGISAGFRLTDLLGDIFTQRAARSENKLDDLLIPLLIKTLKILVVIVGFIYFAQAIDVKITPLLAGLGIGGIGFAFAAQNSIENIFGSVTVLLDRPFQVGDWVVIDDVEGTVVSVGMRSSRIRTFYDSVVTLPNSLLVKNKVNNYGMRTFRRWTTKLGLLYETRPEQVEAYCEGVRELIREHPYTRKDYYQVFLNEFGASGIEVLVYVFWQAPDWQTELRERHRFMLDMMRVAEALGVSFAYPTQTVYLARSPGVPASPSDLDPGQDQAVNEQRGREAARKVVAGAAWLDGKPAPYAFHSAEETLRADRTGREPDSAGDDAHGETKGSTGEGE